MRWWEGSGDAGLRGGQWVWLTRSAHSGSCSTGALSALPLRTLPWFHGEHRSQLLFCAKNQQAGGLGRAEFYLCLEQKDSKMKLSKKTKPQQCCNLQLEFTPSHLSLHRSWGEVTPQHPSRGRRKDIKDGLGPWRPSLMSRLGTALMFTKYSYSRTECKPQGGRLWREIQFAGCPLQTGQTGHCQPWW